MLLKLIMLLVNLTHTIKIECLKLIATVVLSVTTVEDPDTIMGP
jgi:hypothetical protein